MNAVLFKSTYTASELLTFGIFGMPTTKAAVLAKAKREGWLFSESTGIGGRRREYQPPEEVMKAIRDLAATNLLQAAAVAKPGNVVLPQVVAPTKQVALTKVASPGSLNDRQRQTAEARAAILAEIGRMEQLVGREKAIMKMVIMAQDGSLPEHLAALVPVANAKSGEKRTLSRRTLHRWIAEYKVDENGRRQVNALAPKASSVAAHIPAWAADLLAAYQAPQKPSLAWAVEQIARQHGLEECVLYHRARRFLKKMGNVELQVGRMGSREIKNIKPFIRRDTSELWPADIYTADGHCFDSEVAHPAHGKPFRPEVTGIVDVATRRYVGWSVDLAESSLAVLDALRSACQTGGIPSLMYVDNGSGYKNALMSAPGTGMESRLGFTMTNSIAYNSQARGIIERSHQTVWVRAAKELPTYIGASMDRQAMQKVHKITRRDIALSGRSNHLMSFWDFISFCEEQINRYNNRPHRSLAKVFDHTLGRKRHMTPNEAWEAGVKAGAELVTITDAEAIELFRPMKEVKVLRGELRLFNNLYFSLELQEFNGDVVRAAYDVRNAEKVWVYDQQGRFICEAGFEANKRAYYAQSFIDQAAVKRATARKDRLVNKLDEVELELQGNVMRDMPTLENNASPSLHLVDDLRDARELLVLVEQEAAAPTRQAKAAARPIFMLESERYEWLMQSRDQWGDGDRNFLRQFIADPHGYALLAERFELLDIAWSDDLNELLTDTDSADNPARLAG